MSSDNTTRTIVISAEEIREVARLAHKFCRLDERQRAGSVLLTDVNGTRAWLMGHQTGLISLDASDDIGPGDWVIPKRLVHAAAILGDAYGREVVTIDARPILERGGGIHCITQQQPKATS